MMSGGNLCTRNVKLRTDWKRKNTEDVKEAERPELAEAISREKPSNKKNKKEVAIFGNYRNYYGYRVSQDMDKDPRLKVMKKEWFEGNDCLDIGCNSGIITIAIAKMFGCQSILGVDIDGDRINEAYWNLRKVTSSSTCKMTSKNSSSTVVQVNGSENSPEESLVTAESDRDLTEIVSFQKGNFVQHWHPPANKNFNVVLCLSVTKWVHLNWGDEGLITLFSRVWRLLPPGGVFVLEPQPWSSYYKNRHVSQTAATNYKDIQIPPEDFQDVLLDKIGFRRVENLTSGLSGTMAGFNRPMLIFWK